MERRRSVIRLEPFDGEADKAHMDVLKPGGRWISGSSHSINHIPHDNFVAMINAIHRYGRY